jgi:hypothetical protein
MVKLSVFLSVRKAVVERSLTASIQRSEVSFQIYHSLSNPRQSGISWDVFK